MRVGLPVLGPSAQLWVRLPHSRVMVKNAPKRRGVGAGPRLGVRQLPRQPAEDRGSPALG